MVRHGQSENPPDGSIFPKEVLTDKVQIATQVSFGAGPVSCNQIENVSMRKL